MALRLIKKENEIIRLTDAEDLDYVTTQGVYHQPRVVDADLARHYPEKTAGLLEVHDPDGRMVYQRFTCFRSGNMYYRGSYDKVWEPWKKILTE